MPTIEEYLNNIEAKSIYCRLVELQKNKSSTFSKIYNIKETVDPATMLDTQRSSKALTNALQRPYKKEYDDGIELWLGWPLAGSRNLQVGTSFVGVFGLYFPEKKELWEYYIKNIIPTAEDLH